MTVLVTLAIVDQVDAPGAMVELVDGTFVDVPVVCVPRDAAEGDRVRARRSSDECPVRFGRAPLSNKTGRLPRTTRRLP